MTKKLDRFLKWLSIPATVIAMGAAIVTFYQDRQMDELKTKIEKLERVNQQKDIESKLKPLFKG